MQEVLSLLENHLLKKLQTLESLKPFVLSTLRYRVVSFSENSNVPTSEGKVLMEFQNIPTVIQFFKQSGQNT
jgi:hypothetical protein